MPSPILQSGDRAVYVPIDAQPPVDAQYDDHTRLPAEDLTIRQRIGNALRRHKLKLCLALIAALLIIGGTLYGVSKLGKDNESSHVVRVSKAAVSTENPICSDIGVDILKRGGSAVDATIAAGICIGVTNPYSSGIGGGGFMVVYPGKGVINASEFIDFRESAPAAAHKDMYNKDPSLAQFGGLAVAIPGELRGFEAAHQRYGNLPWKDLFEPSIKLAREGWTVSKTLEHRMSLVGDIILEREEWREIFAPHGKLLREGDAVKRTTFARTLETIASKGADAFYTGPIAESLVRTIKNTGGIVTMEDMQSYAARVAPAIEGYYHGHKVVTSPLPTSGPVLISILNLLEGYDLKSEGRTSTNVHRLIESYKHAYAERTFYGDPIDPVYRNITAISEQYMQKDMSLKKRLMIDDDKTYEPAYYGPEFEGVETHGTMHVSVLDENGMGVSMTSTVNLLFGGMVMDRETGIILNDEMDDFSIPNHPNAFDLPASPYNFIHPSKRPLSSSTPAIILSPTSAVPKLIIGASGGSRIITSTVQALVDILSYDMTVEQALSQPRLHHQLLPNEVFVEWEVDGDLVRDLGRKGHKVTRWPKGLYLSGVEIVHRKAEGVVEAGSDWRKGGAARGY
ncbi:gamma-glutamyltranspeptidase [Gaertneriomyces semiglobifer]|nr:gamma-glutamyltranspeptidase [Gaertneriomyces semiglobifer]